MLLVKSDNSQLTGSAHWVVWFSDENAAAMLTFLFTSSLNNKLKQGISEIQIVSEREVHLPTHAHTQAHI
jgi:hypothetical protein